MSVIFHRAPVHRDFAFIVTNWLFSLRPTFVDRDEQHRADAAVRMPRNVYTVGQRARIERVLRDPSTRVVVAALTSDPDTLIGFAIAQGSCLHYVYVEQAWRRQGHSRALIDAVLPNGVRSYSVHTRSGDSFIVARRRNLIFDPYALDPRTP